MTFNSLIRFVSGILFLMIFLSLSSTAQAGGIALGATRLIYSADAKQTSLPVTNSDTKNRFLIQSWIEDANEKKSNHFVLTPPLFVSKPNSENTLRIMYTGPELPKDRETLFWLNSKAIPAVDRDDVKGKNVLHLAILSRIKIFFRPNNLTSSLSEAPAKLTFSRQGKSLKIDNPTPYYITLVNFSVGTKKLPNTMISPKNNKVVQISNETFDVVTYQTINDYGANTPVIKTQVN